MKPQIRPVKALTQEILDSSPAWCFLRGSRLYLYIVKDDDPVVVDFWKWLIHGDGEGFARHDQMSCYPCFFSPAEGIQVPDSWPIGEGEEEIEEWRGIANNEDHTPTLLDDGWDLEDTEGYSTSPCDPIPGQPGFRPAPRRRIEQYGVVVRVWVWEKDR